MFGTTRLKTRERYELTQPLLLESLMKLIEIPMFGTIRLKARERYEITQPLLLESLIHFSLQTNVDVITGAVSANNC